MKNGKLVAVICSIVFLIVGLVMGHMQAQVTASRSYVHKDQYREDIARYREDIRTIKESVDTLIALHMQDRRP